MSGRALPRPSGQLTALLDLIITFILRDGERSMEGMGETGKEQYRDDGEKRKDRHPSHMRSPPTFSAMVAPMDTVKFTQFKPESADFKSYSLEQNQRSQRHWHNQLTYIYCVPFIDTARTVRRAGQGLWSWSRV